MWVLTTERTHYIITMLHVENLYVEVNTYVTVILPSHLSYTVQRQATAAETETPTAMLQDTVASA